MNKASEINEWRYATNNGCKTAQTKLIFKQGDEQKANLYIKILKFTLIHKNITKYSNIIIVCVYVWARVCVCVCVCV